MSTTDGLAAKKLYQNNGTPYIYIRYVLLIKIIIIILLPQALHSSHQATEATHVSPAKP